MVLPLSSLLDSSLNVDAVENLVFKGEDGLCLFGFVGLLTLSFFKYLELNLVLNHFIGYGLPRIILPILLAWLEREFHLLEYELFLLERKLSQENVEPSSWKLVVQFIDLGPLKELVEGLFNSINAVVELGGHLDFDHDVLD